MLLSNLPVMILLPIYIGILVDVAVNLIYEFNIEG